MAMYFHAHAQRRIGSNRPVATYLENAKTKLGVRTIVQAVAASRHSD
jgi:DNA-binding CsgD family transcriptional regulator